MVGWGRNTSQPNRSHGQRMGMGRLALRLEIQRQRVGEEERTACVFSEGPSWLQRVEGGSRQGSENCPPGLQPQVWEAAGRWSSPLYRGGSPGSRELEPGQADEAPLLQTLSGVSGYSGARREGCGEGMSVSPTCPTPGFSRLPSPYYSCAGLPAHRLRTVLPRGHEPARDPVPGQVGGRSTRQPECQIHPGCRPSFKG